MTFGPEAWEGETILSGNMRGKPGETGAAAFTRGSYSAC
jgi:hypothetical protein